MMTAIGWRSGGATRPSKRKTRVRRLVVEGLAGAVGAALCDHCLTEGWVRRTRDSRALTITAEGRAAFASTFGIDTQALVQRDERAAA